MIDLINTSNKFDISFQGQKSNGYKLSIQGKDINDIIFLCNKLNKYLIFNNISFKFATIKRLLHTNNIQNKKIFTIYIPNNINHLEFSEIIYSKIVNYKWWYNIKTPIKYTHYAGGVFFRNDLDIYGNYIPANI